MSDLAARIRETTVSPGDLAIFWLGQAGFVYKTSRDVVFYVDVYLSDCLRRLFPERGDGFKRVMPAPLAAEEVEADYWISTHSHVDHLDVDVIPMVAARQDVRFVGSPDCRAMYEALGLGKHRTAILAEGETLELDGCWLTGVYADHGERLPDAIGVMLEIDGIHVWQVGDTAYRPERWSTLFDRGVDIIIPPINGAFGNLDAAESAQLVARSGAAVAIPCHFWMFTLHNGQPAEFLQLCRELAPQTHVLLMTQGERFVYHRASLSSE